MLGRCTQLEKQIAGLASLISLFGVYFGDSAYVFLPLLLLALVVGPWISAAFGWRTRYWKSAPAN